MDHRRETNFETIVGQGHNQQGRFVLLANGLPADCNRSRIDDFFSPIMPERCEAVIGNHGSHDSPTWRVMFSTRADMDLAMHDKQWQYMDDCCVRLRTVEEYSPMESEASWGCIHRDLQMDILSYFDVIYRSRLRRVCREWNETLQSHWDAEVNRCLYFDFSKHYDVENTMIKDVSRPLRHVLSTNQKTCEKIGRLVLRFPPQVYAVDTFVKADRGTDSRLFHEYLLKHSHVRSLMLTGLLFLNSDIQKSILLFGGNTRWPRNLRVVLHDCSIHHFHIFPIIKNIIPPYVFKSEGNDAYFYTLQIPHLSFEICPDTTEVERHIRLLREMDKRKLFWPYPLQQLQWLKSLLDRYPLDNDCDPGRISRMNAKGEQSLRQAIRRYFQDDLVRKLIPKWEPTGVFFERVELNWRECFFLALATAKWQLLGKPPPPLGMNKLVLDCVANKEESKFAGGSVLEKKVFEQGLARLQPDGSGHYKLVHGSA